MFAIIELTIRSYSPFQYDMEIVSYHRDKTRANLKTNELSCNSLSCLYYEVIKLDKKLMDYMELFDVDGRVND